MSMERTRDSRHGDFASNIAMRLAKSARKNPRELAQLIIDRLPSSTLIEKVDIAGPGFINFFVSKDAFHQAIVGILDQGDKYGYSPSKPEPRYLLEFVSANPTGPLHVGHGRHASFGATVGNLLQAAGYSVDREYYVNDAGRQMDILGLSVWLRMLENTGVDIVFPDAGYKGDYIRDIAATIDLNALPGVDAAQLFDDLPEDAPDGDKEARIDALIERANSLLGQETVRRYSTAIARIDS